MTQFVYLEVKNFRNIHSQFIEPSPGFNLFVGENGSGKTSILEAIHYLGVGRSFRTHLAQRIIQHESEGFTLFSKILDNMGQENTLGLAKNRAGETQIRMNQETVRGVAKLIALSPIQLINHDSYQLLDGGPRIRRQYIDWLAFHVEHTFYGLWQKTHRLLKQRNAAIKQMLPQTQIRAWDSELITTSEALNALRLQYIKQLIPVVENILEQLLSITGLSIHFNPGWNEKYSLAEVLDNNFHNDRRVGYTQHGPHRADLVLRIQQFPVDDVLSRGQQKLFACAMLLAQGILLHEVTGKRCVYLLDDLPAELDPARQQLISQVLSQLRSQVFITGVDEHEMQAMVGDNEKQVFQVTAGDYSLK